jgi:hypothetical protein
MNSAIPVFAVTTINQADSFSKLIESIDYPINTFSVLCNTMSFNYVEEIRKRCISKFVNRFMVSWCPYNMGCSTSWNYHIKMNCDSDYWLFSGDDTVFAPNDLQRSNETMQTCDFLGAAECDCLGVIFGLNKKCVNIAGFFDENIHPVNFEDNEYVRRVRHHRDSIIEKRIPIKSSHIGSGTQLNINRQERNFTIHCYELNRKYYEKVCASGSFVENKFDFDERRTKLLTIE